MPKSEANKATGRAAAPVIRLACAADIAAIAALQLRSMQALGSAHYTAAALAAFLDRFGTMDFAVIGEGHFFVACDEGGNLLGTGGWSRLAPGYQQGAAAGGAAGAPTVRGVYCDPAMARSGIGSAIMRHIEADAARHGVATLKLTATLSGVALYARLGYRELRRQSIDLGDGGAFGCVDMAKRLETASDRVVAA